MPALLLPHKYSSPLFLNPQIFLSSSSYDHNYNFTNSSTNILKDQYKPSTHLESLYNHSLEDKMSSKNAQSGASDSKSQMTSSDASRIQSSNVGNPIPSSPTIPPNADIRTPFQAKSGGDMSSSGFSARAQSAAATNENAGKAGSGNNGGSKKN